MPLAKPPVALYPAGIGQSPWGNLLGAGAVVDVFISYSRRDQQMVALLARAIEAEGYEVWWDAELPPHQSYGDVITAKIGGTRAALVVWSEEAVKSQWVRAEADMARNQGKLIQTALQDVMPPLPFNQIQYAELGGWRGEPDHPGWRKVKMSLADLCGPRDPVDVPPAERFRDEPRSPPPPREGEGASRSATARWPLFAGLGLVALAVALAGGILLGQRSAAPVAEPVGTGPPAAQEVPVAEAPPPQADAALAAEADEAAGDGAEAPPPPDPADFTFADSSTRLIEPHELASFGPATLKVARNEIYARKGRRFKDPWLRDWFARYAWYRPRFDEVRLNEVEQRNVALIRQAEARFGQ